MSRSQLTRRQLAVTAEPFVIGGNVRGRPLATTRRRGVALVFDFVLCFLLATPVILALAFGALHLQTPALAKNLTAVVSGAQTEDVTRGRPMALK